MVIHKKLKNISKGICQKLNKNYCLGIQNVISTFSPGLQHWLLHIGNTPYLALTHSSPFPCHPSWSLSKINPVPLYSSGGTSYFLHLLLSRCSPSFSLIHPTLLFNTLPFALLGFYWLSKFILNSLTFLPPLHCLPKHCCTLRCLVYHPLQFSFVSSQQLLP